MSHPEENRFSEPQFLAELAAHGIAPLGDRRGIGREFFWGGGRSVNTPVSSPDPGVHP